MLQKEMLDEHFDPLQIQRTILGLAGNDQIDPLNNACPVEKSIRILNFFDIVLIIKHPPVIPIPFLVGPDIPANKIDCQFLPVYCLDLVIMI